MQLHAVLGIARDRFAHNIIKHCLAAKRGPRRRASSKQASMRDPIEALQNPLSSYGPLLSLFTVSVTMHPVHVQMKCFL